MLGKRARFNNVVFGQLLAVTILCHSAGALSAPQPLPAPLLVTNNIEVTEQDLFFYLKDRLSPQVYESALEKPDAVLNAALNLYTLRRVAQAGMADHLLSPEEIEYVKQDAADRAVLEVLVDRAAQTVDTGTDWEQLAKEEYLRNANDYEGVEQVSVEHILLTSRDGNLNELTAKAEVIAGRLANGEDFSALALELSEATNAPRNAGKLGFISRGQTEPNFERAAFNLEKPGEISPPVVTSYGVHFIRLVDTRVSEPRSFESAKRGLIASLREKRLAQVREEAVSGYRNEAMAEALKIEQEQVATELLKRLRGSI
jgi:peptidyl-prolyl cis-trans isomerase C